MYIQVMTEEQASNHPYNPFDLTKVWYKKDFPLIEVGEFELNRNPENYFAEVEQAAFAPTNMYLVLDSHQIECYKDVCSLMEMRNVTV